MISKIKILLVFYLFCINTGYTQAPKSPVNGGEYVFNPSKIPCLTATERKDIKESLKRSTEVLKAQNKLAFLKRLKDDHPLFIWPVRKASHVTLNDVWSVSGYVDHNPGYPNQLTDYNGGTITYDTEDGYNHLGVDIYTWPYTWKLMDDNSAEIIAAADGQIISKTDGHFDRSCNFNSNQWNAVYIQHNDGSIAFYGHIKNGTLTTKNVGDMVEQSEYLGVVGSSGNSTGPHLHFEVYTDNTYTQLIDPFAGGSNTLNSESWWTDQKPYKKPNINASMTHTQPPNIFPDCPTTETTYESTEFAIDDTVYLSTYLRDQQEGDILNLRILRPNNSAILEWKNTATATSTSWYYWWTFTPDTVGEWTWEVTSQGQTLLHTFNVSNTLSLKKNAMNTIKIYPNPTQSLVHISSEKRIIKAAIVSISGKTIISKENYENSIETLDIEILSNGVYFLSLTDDANESEIIKLVKH